ncbi:hypothetical protein [Pseudactinotalea suaedae]|uniref:hypothetical protein n=1 Tax=Pseudactinotalea suaedae TaxID=1524924 RepID=UPI0012E1711E|nr:hypothetical protein [Pseudactinotalea suaedae]
MTTWARRTSALAAAAFLVAGLAACQAPDEGRSPEPGDGDVTTLTPTDEPTEDMTDDESAEPTDPPSGPADPRVEAAVTDLAERLEVTAEDVTAGPLEEVTWTDGSIGCPAEGQSYTQALVPGARLVLTVDGAEYAYHGEGEEPLFYCETPIEPAASDDATA